MGKELIKDLEKKKIIAMLAPSFVAEFEYPEIISQLHSLGFDKVVELTFGAKMINRLYHSQLLKNKKLLISSVCPGIVSVIKKKYPEYIQNLAKIDSPIIATAKICKRVFKQPVCFISPCNFKKQEAENSKYVDYVIDYNELKQLFASNKRLSKPTSKVQQFDKFYNDFTKIYPLSGGLSKTSHLKGVLKKNESKIIDGILEVEKFLKNPGKIRFLDCTFCHGGCIGAPFISNKNIGECKKKVLDYLKLSKKEKISKTNLGLIERASGINFSH